jgi:hypothetical protein
LPPERGLKVKATGAGVDGLVGVEVEVDGESVGADGDEVSCVGGAADDWLSLDPEQAESSAHAARAAVSAVRPCLV